MGLKLRNGTEHSSISWRSVSFAPRVATLVVSIVCVAFVLLSATCPSVAGHWMAQIYHTTHCHGLSDEHPATRFDISEALQHPEPVEIVSAGGPSGRDPVDLASIALAVAAIVAFLGALSERSKPAKPMTSFAAVLGVGRWHRSVVLIR